MTASAGTSTSIGAGVEEPGAKGDYKPTSDVAAHAAIGKDIIALKAAMDPATKGMAVDWAAVGNVFEKGGASKKSDGTNRTLAGLVPDSQTVSFVRDAIRGTGASSGAPDPIRRQQVDKGISVLLAEKMDDELAVARTKIEAKKLDVNTGAPHNVDEAWAFFTAEGNGLATTAEKRAADFTRDGTVKEPILAALTAAQTAAQQGDLTAFDSAAGNVNDGTAYVFYLATYKYLEGKDEVARTEGAVFYRGIAPRVQAKDPAAHKVIVAAFATPDPAGGRAALNSAPVLAALGVSGPEKVG